MFVHARVFSCIFIYELLFRNLTCHEILPSTCLCVVCARAQVLNEVVVDRGPSSYLSNVDLYLDGRLITSVQGDGKGSAVTAGGVGGGCEQQ